MKLDMEKHGELKGEINEIKTGNFLIPKKDIPSKDVAIHGASMHSQC